MPRLGRKYDITVEEFLQSREAYQSETYLASGRPAAPALMVEDEIAGQGPTLSEEKIEAVSRRHLELPASME
jgi:hypothetical protein